MRTGCTGGDKGGEEEHREISLPDNVSVTVPIPEQERGSRRGEREETPLLGLHNPGGSGARLQPAEVLGELPSFLFFLAVGIVIVWDFEPLWEQAWYLCPTKTNPLAFVSAGCCREYKAPLPLYHTLLPRRSVLKLRTTGRRRREALEVNLLSKFFLPCQLELAYRLCWCIFWF